MANNPPKHRNDEDEVEFLRNYNLNDKNLPYLIKTIDKFKQNPLENLRNIYLIKK